MSTQFVVRLRRGEPVVFSKDILLWRRRGGPAHLHAAVAQQMALNASRRHVKVQRGGVDPELLRILNLIHPRA